MPLFPPPPATGTRRVQGITVFEQVILWRGWGRRRSVNLNTISETTAAVDRTTRARLRGGNNTVSRYYLLRLFFFFLPNDPVQILAHGLQ